MPEFHLGYIPSVSELVRLHSEIPKQLIDETIEYWRKLEAISFRWRASQRMTAFDPLTAADVETFSSSDYAGKADNLIALASTLGYSADQHTQHVVDVLHVSRHGLYWAAQGRMSDAQAAAHFGVSADTIEQRVYQAGWCGHADR